MKYTLEEHIADGRDIYTLGMSCAEAMKKYNISHGSIERYVELYKESIGINGTRSLSKENQVSKQISKSLKSSYDYYIETYIEMSKEELVNELIRAKINEARAKKGYEVKWDGTNKEFSSLYNKNSK